MATMEKINSCFLCNLSAKATSKRVKSVHNIINFNKMELTPVFVLAIIFGFSYAVIYLIVRKKERMALLERGVDASFFINPVKQQSFIALKFGLLFIGLAIGIFAGGLLNHLTPMDQEESYFSMIFLFGGLGLVINHYMEKAERAEMERNKPKM